VTDFSKFFCCFNALIAQKDTRTRPKREQHWISWQVKVFLNLQAGSVSQCYLPPDTRECPPP